MLLGFFLSLVLLGRIEQTPPEVFQRFAKQDECVLAAMRLNASPRMQTPEAKAADAMFVCLAAVDASY